MNQIEIYDKHHNLFEEFSKSQNKDQIFMKNFKTKYNNYFKNYAQYENKFMKSIDD